MPERRSGLVCPRCGAGELRVYDSGFLPKELRGLPILRRLRKCEACDKKFSTIEMTEDLFEQLKWPRGLRRNVIRSPE